MVSARLELCDRSVRLQCLSIGIGAPRAMGTVPYADSRDQAQYTPSVRVGNMVTVTHSEPALAPDANRLSQMCICEDFSLQNQDGEAIRFKNGAASTFSGALDYFVDQPHHQAVARNMGHIRKALPVVHFIGGVLHCLLQTAAKRAQNCLPVGDLIGQCHCCVPRSTRYEAGKGRYLHL